MRLLKYIGIMCLMAVPLLSQDARVQQHFSVQTVRVQKEDVSTSMKNYGYVVSDQSRRYDISPRFGGYVVALYADKVYKKVKKGEALAQVYSPEVFKAKDEYLNTYKYTRKRPSQGMLSSARLKLELLGISSGEIDRIIKEDRAAPNTTIYAPVDGYIFKKGIQEGSAFKAKERLFEIVNLDEVWVEAKLFEEERARLSRTNVYELRFKGVDTKYRTRNVLLYPELDPKEATMILRLRVKNPQHALFPGMYANILSLSDSHSALVLPSTAVIRKNGKHYVFMVGDFKGEYEPKEISVNALDADRYEILDGLEEGDEVVNNALFMMDSDAQINGLY